MQAARTKNQPSSVASCSDVFGPASSASATPNLTSVSRTYAQRQRHSGCYNQQLAIYALQPTYRQQTALQAKSAASPDGRTAKRLQNLALCICCGLLGKQQRRRSEPVRQRHAPAPQHNCDIVHYPGWWPGPVPAPARQTDIRSMPVQRPGCFTAHL